MARKKNYKDGELEQEFERYKFYHKLIVVCSTLQVLEEGKVKDLMGDIQEDREAFIDELTESLYAKHFDEEDDSELNKLYAYCWDKLVVRIPDNANFKREMERK